MPAPLIIPLAIAVGGSAALDAVVQKVTRGRVGWGEVLLSGALGLIPGGVWVATGAKVVKPAVTAARASEQVLQRTVSEAATRRAAPRTLAALQEAQSAKRTQQVATGLATLPVVGPEVNALGRGVVESTGRRREAASAARARQLEEAADGEPQPAGGPPAVGMARSLQGQ